MHSLYKKKRKEQKLPHKFNFLKKIQHAFWGSRKSKKTLPSCIYIQTGLTPLPPRIIENEKNGRTISTRLYICLDPYLRFRLLCI